MVAVFQAEIDDGLTEAIQNDTSVAFVVEINKEAKFPNPDIFKACAISHDFAKQLDLFYFESILVSTGWNKNDDVFDKAELWNAKATPINKKINYMHDEKDIIGHMVKSTVIDNKNRVVQFDTPMEMIPDQFDILVGGVLYKMWENPDLQKRMDSIMTDMSIGKWKVSMECLYPTFDYAVKTPDGQNKIIPRNESTAFLSKYLRRYGGEGHFEGFTLGRLLRGIIFSGKGVVDEPANPKSIITKTEYSEFLGTAASVEILQKTETGIMPDMTYTKEQYDELKVRLEKAEACAKEVADKNANQEKETLRLTIAKLEKDNSALTSELSITKEVTKANEAKVQTLETELKTTKTDLTKANEDLAKVAKESLKARRLAMFNDVEVEAAKAEELVTKFLEASDEMFDELVKAMPKKKPFEKKDEKPACAAPITPETALATAKITDTSGTPAPDDASQAKAKLLEGAKAWISKSFKSTKKGE